MKRIIYYILIVLVASSCNQHTAKHTHTSPGFTNSITINKSDSIEYERKWKDPEYYVFDKPSRESILKWKNACEEFNSYYNHCMIPDDMLKQMSAYLTFSDWMEVCCAIHDNAMDIDEEDAFLIWRMNEMLPPKSELEGEVQRYQHFRLQADRLNHGWDSHSGWEDNFGAALRNLITRVQGRVYADRLRKALPSISRILEKEEHAYEEFYSFANDTFEKCQMSADGNNGSGATAIYSSFSKEVAEQRCQAIIPFYLFVTDPQNAKKSATHAQITDEMLSDEYFSFSHDLPNDWEGAYPIEEQQSALSAEQKAWERWMITREEVSSHLSGMERRIWDNSTNNLRRSHLISLKNRYNGHGYSSLSEIESMIPDSVSDKVLFADRYDALVDNAGDNVYFYSLSEGCAILEACSDSLDSFISRTVDLGKNIGRARIAIENKDTLGLVPMVIMNSKEYKLISAQHNSYCIYASVALLDLDRDGINEILVHDGDMFSLKIYSIKTGEPSLLGSMQCNNGIFLTDDGTLAARLGTQGNASLVRLVNDKLIITEGDVSDIIPAKH